MSTRSDNEERVQQILWEALKLSGEARSTYLASACAGDAALQGEVQSLLEAEEQAGTFLCSQAARSGPTVPLAEKAGDHIGRYKLLEQIGEGGFGVVWMAEQEEPVRRRVGLKIIKLGMDTREVVARFEAERQALAMMDHPNIARVFDAGATDKGRPYFVMELVKGIPITEYCDARRLPTRQRLELFIQVCQAIQHAHQKGVIHRDLKPSNILVTVQDDRAVPKVIDFGVAKATQARLTEKTLFTRFQQWIGTPAYMSPEQAGLGNLDVDTRSDIYSLGVLLYELLTGRTPFDPQKLLAVGHDAVMRTIREEEPPKPSTRISTLAEEELKVVAAMRGAEPTKLDRLVRGDLDWVVMKALEKDRTRRYESISAFARDLEMFLQDKPVGAAAPSWSYQARKFARRHKAGLLTATALVLMLVAGTTLSIWQAIRATKAERSQARLRLEAQDAQRNESRMRQEAERQRARAEEERNRAGDHAYRATMLLAQAHWDAENLQGLHQLLTESASYPARGFEWYFWQQQLHLEEVALQDSADLYRLIYSPDGKLLAGLSGSRFTVWETAGGRTLFTLSNYIVAVTFLPDNKRILMVEPDVVPYQVKPQFEDAARNHKPGEPIPPDWLTVISYETPRLRDAFTGRDLGSFARLDGPAISRAFSPDRTRVLRVRKHTADGAQTQEQSAEIWDLHSGKQLFTLKHGDAIISDEFSPPGDRILTSGLNGVMKLWDAATGREVFTLDRYTDIIDFAGFCPDSKRIVTLNRWEPGRFWDSSTGMELLKLRGPNVFGTKVGAFSPDGGRLAVGSPQGINVYDAKNGAELFRIKGHREQIHAIAYSPDRQQLASASPNGARIWNALQRPGPMIITTNPCQSVALSDQPAKLVTGETNGSVNIWDLATGRHLLKLEGHTGAIKSVAISSDGSRVASLGYDDRLKLWDGASGQLLFTVKLVAMSVAFSPDAKRLVASVINGAEMFEVPSGRRMLSLVGLNGWVHASTFSPDGGSIITGGEYQPVKVWNATSGSEPLSIDAHPQCWVQSVSFSPDGKWILTAATDCTAKIWDATTGRLLRTFSGHTQLIQSAAFFRSGNRIITGGWDGEARVWDVASGRELLSLRHNDWIYSLAVSSDERRVVTAGEGGVKVWKAASPEQVADWGTR